MNGTTSASDETQQDLDTEIAILEARLAAAKQARRSNGLPSSAGAPAPPEFPTIISDDLQHQHQQQQSLHALLLLADSALPLGSFAFSSGLESYLAHQKLKPKKPATANSSSSTPARSAQSQFQAFLKLSLHSLAGTALPFVLAAYRQPHRLAEWDDTFDAITLCNVAQRASVAQGKGLLGVWTRSFAAGFGGGYGGDDSTGLNGETDGRRAALDALREFQAGVRAAPATLDGAGGDGWAAGPPVLSGHYPPLWGVVTLLLGLSARDSVYLFLFSHLRTIVSSAVRASVLGPYQAQAVLSSPEIKQLIAESMDGMEARRVEDAAQVVPVMDLWMGRHEVLYSRIFNS